MNTDSEYMELPDELINALYPDQHELVQGQCTECGGNNVLTIAERVWLAWNPEQQEYELYLKWMKNTPNYCKDCVKDIVGEWVPWEVRIGHDKNH